MNKDIMVYGGITLVVCLALYFGYKEYKKITENEEALRESLIVK